MADLKKLRALVKKHGVQYIDLKFSDLIGDWHHITIPVSSLKPDLFKVGVGVDGSSLPGYTSIERGDMLALPDADTAFIDPFYERPTLSFICDIMSVGKNVEEYSRNPRRVVRDADKYLKKMIPGTDLIIGPEFEFHIFDDVRFYYGPEQGYYFVDTSEAEWNTGGEGGKNLGYKVQYKHGYHAAPPKDRTYNIRSEICSLISDVGVNVKYHHHEVGGASQHEIEPDLTEMVLMSDQSMMVKYFVKNYSYSLGKSATFMPKPLFNEPGSGLHVHQYLAKNRKSIFYDRKGPANFSKLGLYYIGGLLKHAGALFAFTNPSTNSYKRLVPGFEAPVWGAYSVGNRTACIRIPGYIRNPAVHRLEFRPPDGTCNLYLAYAAMLMAGLDGIKNQIDPGEPVNKNLDLLPEKELKKIPLLPTSLTKALNALESDYDFLLQGGVFTEDLIQSWIKLKRRDVEEIRYRPHPWEFRLYYDK